MKSFDYIIIWQYLFWASFINRRISLEGIIISFLEMSWTPLEDEENERFKKRIIVVYRIEKIVDESEVCVTNLIRLKGKIEKLKGEVSVFASHH